MDEWGDGGGHTKKGDRVTRGIGGEEGEEGKILNVCGKRELVHGSAFASGGNPLRFLF